MTRTQLRWLRRRRRQHLSATNCIGCLGASGQAPDLRAMTVPELIALVKRRRRRLNQAHQKVMGLLAAMGSKIAQGILVGRAILGRRRRLAARSAALNARRQRLDTAMRFLSQALKAAGERRQALKLAAIAALRTPIQVQHGRYTAQCATHGGLGAADASLGLPGSAYTGAITVPQAIASPAQEVLSTGLRYALQLATLPPEFQPPGVIHVPNQPGVTLPGVAAAQPHIPSFVPGLRTRLQPPEYIGIRTPPIPVVAPPQPAIPAAAQHPLRRRQHLPRRGPVPPVVARARARWFDALRSTVPVPGGVVQPQAETAPAETAPAETVERPITTEPTAADLGGLAADPLMADVAGLYGDVTLAAEAEFEGIRQRARARHAARTAAAQRGTRTAAGRTYTQRLEAHKLRSAREIDHQLTAIGLRVARRHAGGRLPAATVRHIARISARGHARREARLARRVGRRPRQTAIRRREQALARQAVATRDPCA